MGIVKQMWLEELDARGELETDYDPEFLMDDPFKDSDTKRLTLHRHDLIPMNQDEMEFRYERRGDLFMIKRWYNGTEQTERGNVDQTPDWLSRIVAVSRVGNHIRATNNPPPDEILWFRTDPQRNLTTFIDLEDTK